MQSAYLSSTAVENGGETLHFLIQKPNSMVYSGVSVSKGDRRTWEAKMGQEGHTC
jgi:hypothetical protein